MLGKLLKYEIPAVGRRLGPLYIAWAAASVLLGLSLRTVNSKTELFMILSSVIYIGVTVAVFVMALIMIFQRYNNSLLGDEAYFNLVLPVTVTEHIANKTISAMLWMAVSGVASLVSILLIGLFGAGLKELLSFEWIQSLAELLRHITWQSVVVFFEILIGGLLSIVKSVLAIYSAITIGHQAKQHTVLLGIAAYIGLSSFESIVARIMMIPIMHFPDGLFGGNWFIRTQMIGLILLVTVLILSAVYFFICKYFMEKKLDLN